MPILNRLRQQICNCIFLCTCPNRNNVLKYRSALIKLVFFYLLSSNMYMFYKSYNHNCDCDTLQFDNKIENKLEALKIVQQKLKVCERKCIQNEDGSKFDYAKESFGGKVVKVNPAMYSPPSCKSDWLWNKMKNLLKNPISNAQVILRPGIESGMCWAFQGSQGFVVIQLSSDVVISSFSIEHIPAYLSPTNEISSAPKDIKLQGLKDIDDKFGFDFGKFTYNSHGSPLQHFNVQHSSSNSFRMVKFSVLSNSGNACFTSVYKIKVHGK